MVFPRYCHNLLCCFDIKGTMDELRAWTGYLGTYSRTKVSITEQVLKNACIKIMYVNGLLTSLNLSVNSNCREKIKEFVVHGFESSILPLPVCISIHDSFAFLNL